MKKHRKHSRGDKKHGRGRSPRKTNPRRSGQSGTPEQNPVQQNAPVNGPQVGPNHNRTTVVIKHHCSQWEQSVIERQFPHLSFNFVNTRKRHQHIIVNTQRRQGECDAMRMLKPLCSRRNPLLDVGFSMRTRRPWVHGCTRVDTPYEERKFRDVLERHPNNVMNYDDVAIPNRTRWSYCKCDALSCHHVVQPGAAMFIHSIYYNTVDQIAAIINNTVSKRGVAIFHPFWDDFSGKFSPSARGLFGVKRTNNGKFAEAVYRRKGNNIEMLVKGNCRKYTHPNIDWIMEKSHVQTPDGVLTWTIAPVDVDGQTYMADFRIYQGQGQLTDANRDFFSGRVTQTEGGTSGIVRVHDTDLTIFQTVLYELGILHAQKAEVKQDSASFLLDLEGVNYVLPKKYINYGLRFLAGKEISPKIVKQLYSELRIRSNMKLYQDTEGSAESTDAQLILSMNIVVEYCVRKTISMSAYLEPLYTRKTQHAIIRHNRLISGRGPRRIKVWLKLGLFCFALVYHAIHIVGSIMGHFLFNVLSMISSVFVTAIFGSVYVYIECAYASTGSTILGIGSLAFLVVFILIVTLIYSTIQGLKDTAWRAFKSLVENERRTCEVNCSVPFGEYLKSFETIYSIDDIVVREGARLKITVDKLDEEKPTPGSIPIAVGFTSAVPLVFSTSQHNMYVSFMTRVLADVPRPERNYWSIIQKNCGSYLGYSRVGNHPMPSVTRFELMHSGGPIIFEYPDESYFTFENYMGRFPGLAKKQRIAKAKERLESGNMEQRHFCYKAFVKREKQMVITKNDYQPVKPRAIQGACELTKPASGVWFLRFSYALKFEWNPTYWIWFCSGYTTDIFNWWIQYHVERLGGIDEVVFFYSDYSKFDMTHTKFVKDALTDEYEFLGAEDGIVQWKFIKRMKKYSRVYGDGLLATYMYETKSGDNDTSSGNSWKTGCANAEYMEDILGPYARENCAITIIGDDNFTIINRAYLEKCLETENLALTMKNSAKAFMADLGFICKPGFTEKLIEAEYISKRFYPVNGMYRIGCKPGRVITKIGWMMYKTGLTEEDWYNTYMATLNSYLPTCAHVPFLRVFINESFKYLADKGYEPVGNLENQYRLQGEIYEPADDTYAAFYDLYGYSRADEVIFSRNFRNHLEKYGMPSIMDSSYVDHMFAIDTLVYTL